MAKANFHVGPPLKGSAEFIVYLVMAFFLAPMLHILTVKPVLYLIMYITT
jgi:hypothetical protein